METINVENKYITPIGHYKIVSTPIKYENGETICVFSTVKIEDEDKKDVNNNDLKNKKF
jgi:hypothetical protein